MENNRLNTSLIFLANGFEEIEALATADIMRRAGMPVTLVSLDATNQVTGANDITVVADTNINDLQADEFEWLVVPGGIPGAHNVAANEKAMNMLSKQFEAGKKIAAICAAPGVVLAPLGILDGRSATCYPGFDEFFPSSCKYTGSRVEVDSNLITANGPGAAMLFGYAIVSNTLGEDAAQQLQAGMQWT